MDNLIWIIASLTAASGMLVIAISTLLAARRYSAAQQLAVLVDAEPHSLHRLQIISSMFVRIGQWLTPENNSADEIRQLLSKAGYTASSALYVFATFRAAFSVSGALLVLALRGSLLTPTPSAIATALFAGFVFFRSASIVLKMMGERRIRLIQSEFPPVIDIILMTLDSGVSIDQSLRYVAVSVPKSAPIVSAILVKHIRDVDSGMPYEKALDRLGVRLGIEEGYDFANIIKQALLFGGELTSTLRRFSIDLSDKRLGQARENVGRRSTHLTLVMIGFFIPVLLVVLAGPAVINLTDTLHNATLNMKNQRHAN